MFKGQKVKLKRICRYYGQDEQLNDFIGEIVSTHDAMDVYIEGISAEHANERNTWVNVKWTDTRGNINRNSYYPDDLIFLEPASFSSFNEFI